MRALIMFLAAAVVLFPLTANAIDVSGDQWGTWTRDNSPYNVVGEIRVPPESTLVIRPGIVVDFQGHYKFIVDSLATLLAVGTETDSIFFTCDTTANPDRWHGIRFIYASSNSEISYCQVEYAKATGNPPDSYGGAIYCYYSSPTISNNLIQRNWASVGSGIFCELCSPRICRNTIRGNTARSGGGIHFWTSGSTISENTINGNSAEQNGGAILCSGSDLTITNNVISNNSAGMRGGGISCWNSNPLIKNNTITANWGGDGGGIHYRDGSSPVIINTILWGDTASNGPEICRGYNGGDLTVSYSDVQGGWPGVGNIDADPLFVDPPASDFHLQWGSPCIDAGDPNSPLDPDGTRADIGALYFPQVVFSPHEFTFNLLIYSSTSKELTIENRNRSQTLEFILSSDVDWISFLPDSGYIPPDSTFDVSVTFDGSGLPLGPNTATILLDILAPYQAECEIPVTVHIFSTEYTYISLTPDSLPITIPPEGGSFSFWAQTFNATDFTYYFDLWIDADLPTRQKYGPIYKRPNYRFRPQYNSGYHLTQNVPGFAPAGEYSYNFKMGVLPDQVDFQDRFTFTKLGSGSYRGRVSVTSWDLVGWGEEFIAYLDQAQGQTASIPTVYALSQNYPNPFNAKTIIDYQLPVDGRVKLEVYNLLGKKVVALVDEMQEAGYRSASWDASAVSSGVYFYKLTAGDFTETKRMMLVK